MGDRTSYKSPNCGITFDNQYFHSFASVASRDQPQKKMHEIKRREGFAQPGLLQQRSLQWIPSINC
jgi:hypothetical protein